MNFVRFFYVSFCKNSRMDLVIWEPWENLGKSFPFSLNLTLSLNNNVHNGIGDLTSAQELDPNNN